MDGGLCMGEFQPLLLKSCVFGECDIRVAMLLPTKIKLCFMPVM